MKQWAGETRAMTWREQFFKSFDNEETMVAYYGERTKYMIRIYCLMITAKLGYIAEIVTCMTIQSKIYREDTLIQHLFPETDEGNTALQQARIIAIT